MIFYSLTVQPSGDQATVSPCDPTTLDPARVAAFAKALLQYRSQFHHQIAVEGYQGIGMDWEPQGLSAGVATFYTGGRAAAISVLASGRDLREDRRAIERVQGQLNEMARTGPPELRAAVSRLLGPAAAVAQVTERPLIASVRLPHLLEPQANERDERSANTLDLMAELRLDLCLGAAFFQKKWSWLIRLLALLGLIAGPRSARRDH